MSRTRQTPEKPPRLEYTGQTEGGIVIAPNRVQAVTPGFVIAPDDAEHAELLQATGHFVETTKRATKVEAEADASAGDAAPEPGPSDTGKEPE